MSAPVFKLSQLEPVKEYNNLRDGLFVGYSSELGMNKEQMPQSLILEDDGLMIEALLIEVCSPWTKYLFEFTEADMNCRVTIYHFPRYEPTD